MTWTPGMKFAPTTGYILVRNAAQSKIPVVMSFVDGQGWAAVEEMLQSVIYPVKGNATRDIERLRVPE